MRLDEEKYELKGREIALRSANADDAMLIRAFGDGILMTIPL